ncbi:hypothetical protein [Paraclostridium bifermentans]|uniref:hypothetical protein n=1 Tax=Paraclostridium bifermentans TaxID=1490 RepID=UPI00359C7B87
MVGIIFGIAFIILGLKFIYIGFDIKRSKDIYKIKNNMIKPESIKDKEGYLKFNFTMNIIIGISLFINGIVALLAEYFVAIDNISSSVNAVVALVIIGCIFKWIFTVTKFNK